MAGTATRSPFLNWFGGVFGGVLGYYLALFVMVAVSSAFFAGGATLLAGEVQRADTRNEKFRFATAAFFFGVFMLVCGTISLIILLGWLLWAF